MLKLILLNVFKFFVSKDKSKAICLLDVFEGQVQGAGCRGCGRTPWMEHSHFLPAKINSLAPRISLEKVCSLYHHTGGTESSSCASARGRKCFEKLRCSRKFWKIVRLGKVLNQTIRRISTIFILELQWPISCRIPRKTSHLQNCWTWLGWAYIILERELS